MRISVNPRYLNEHMAYLSDILPPIKFSLDVNTDEISLNSNIGEFKITDGSTEDIAIRFHEFLYSRGLLLTFILNVFRYEGGHTETNFNYCYSFISSAFNWRNTNEDTGFWGDLAQEFDDEINKGN